jgi:hypothetical protein
MEATVQVVVWAVVVARFALPLLIPRFPLPGVLACLVLDAVDQTIFQSVGLDPPWYQGYDKAMDVFYLSIAYVAALRSWTNVAALRILRFLLFYRLVGAALFELTGWRPLLLIFPNTFEYFFIAYEVVRLRWDPRRYGMRFWLLLAGGIWVVIKLPQEWWIHIAQLDVTDALRDWPWFAPALVVGLVVLLLLGWFVVRPRLDPPDWPWRVRAEPVPAGVDEARERDAVMGRGRLVDLRLLEKVALVGLVSVIFSAVLPGLRATPAQVLVGVSAIVVANAALTLGAARRRRSLTSLVATVAVLAAVDLVLVVAGAWLLDRSGGSLQVLPTLFFVVLVSLLTVLYDRYRVVHDYRMATATPAAPSMGPPPPRG